jgi:DNA-binding transcriptional ArsR family regulator
LLPFLCNFLKPVDAWFQSVTRWQGKSVVARTVFNSKYQSLLIFMAMTTTSHHKPSAEGRVFTLAAELFAVLATPIRLQILSAVCEQEKSVSQLLLEIDTTQPNLSQHLAVLFKTGVLAKRKDGTQVIYRVHSEKAVALCRSVCTQIAIEMDEPDAVSEGQGITPRIPVLA